MSSDKQLHKDKDFSFEPVPFYARKSFWSMFFIMLGFTFFSASMSVGAIIIFDYFGHPQHYEEGAEEVPGTGNTGCPCVGTGAV